MVVTEGNRQHLGRDRKMSHILGNVNFPSIMAKI